MIAACATMQYDPALFGRVLNADWPHEPATSRQAITRHNVDMLAVQTKRTMVTIAPRGERRDTLAAVLADKRVVTDSAEILPHTLLATGFSLFF